MNYSCTTDNPFNTRKTQKFAKTKETILAVYNTEFCDTNFLFIQLCVEKFREFCLQNQYSIKYSYKHISEDYIYPPKLWTHASSELTRTTNACESFHANFKNCYYRHSPSILQRFNILTYKIQTDFLIDQCNRGEIWRYTFYKYHLNIRVYFKRKVSMQPIWLITYQNAEIYTQLLPFRPVLKCYTSGRDKAQSNRRIILT
ncbi:MULE domain-containing protein [Aphis craccivora]|uniref:MULE domain-containing protein n=1 Tax=Aphis craccivora TaxID=307492 RepID=A0A6G0ZGH7_APHCR|nr:MULE domain-containing protein [Aphis craccivora]